jgi:hypothetical protein
LDCRVGGSFPSPYSNPSSFFLFFLSFFFSFTSFQWSAGGSSPPPSSPAASVPGHPSPIELSLFGPLHLLPLPHGWKYPIYIPSPHGFF